MPPFARGYRIALAVFGGGILLATLAGLYSVGNDVVALSGWPSPGSDPQVQGAVAGTSTPFAIETLGPAGSDAPLAVAGPVLALPQGYTLSPGAPRPNVSAISYIVGDVSSGEIAAEKYKEYEMPIASITKLVTALVTYDELPLDTSVHVSATAVATYDTAGELSVGERLPVSELLYAMLLESSNDAAEALAETADRTQFIASMNAKAQKIGMTHTAFDDPSGLSPNDVSTTEDLFTLARYISNNKPDIWKISLAPAEKYGRHDWLNISKFLKFPSYRGGKVGYTDEAGKTIITLWDIDFGAAGHRTLSIVLLDSSDNQKDIISLLNYIQKYVLYDGQAAKLGS